LPNIEIRRVRLVSEVTNKKGNVWHRELLDKNEGNALPLINKKFASESSGRASKNLSRSLALKEQAMFQLCNSGRGHAMDPKPFFSLQ
jgi:hypothetical protein